MSTTRKAVAAVLASGMGLVIGGCDDSSGAGGASAGSRGYEPTSSVDAGPNAQGITRPGAVLMATQAATVSYVREAAFDDPAVQATLTIKLQGRPREVPVESLGSTAQSDLGGEVPKKAYEVRYSVINDGKDLWEADMLVDGTDDEGSSMSNYATSEGSCQGLGEFVQPGQTFEACAFVLSTTGAPPATIEYSDDGPYDDAPLVWDLD